MIILWVIKKFQKQIRFPIMQPIRNVANHGKKFDFYILNYLPSLNICSSELSITKFIICNLKNKCFDSFIQFTLICIISFE